MKNKISKYAVVLMAWVSLCGSVQAQNFPSKPIKIVVGYAAGGAVDAVARSVGQSIASSTGQTVLVDNKPGAGTNIAVKSVIAAEPDGYTLLMAANALAANMALYQPMPFDAEKELTAVSLVGRVPVVIAANPSVPYNNVKQLIEAAKNKPNTIAYGSPGNGSTPHMAIELKVLGVLSPARSPIFPDAPTIAESGFPGFEASVWYGLVAPAATPKPVIQKLHEEVQKALQTKDVRDRMTQVGGEVVPGSSDMFTALIHSEHLRYAKLVKEANIKPD